MTYSQGDANQPPQSFHVQPISHLMSYTIGIGHVLSQQTYMENIMNIFSPWASLLHTTLDQFS